MRHPLTHKFFIWFGPAALASIAAAIGLVAALAPTYPDVKAWGQHQFELWQPIVSNPWSFVAATIIAAAYVGVIVWSAKPANPDLSSLNPSHGPDQLYLMKSRVGDDISHKSYLITWSPHEYFWIYISDYESQSRTWPPSDPKEISPTFHLLNVGPDEVRHVKVTWHLGDLHIPRRVRETGLFEGFIETFNAHQFTLVHDGVGAIERPIGQQAEVVIPIIEAGESIAVSPPIGVTMAWALYALCEAKRISSQPIDAENLSSIRTAMLAMKRDATSMKPVGVTIEYIGKDRDARKQEFVVTGQIRGRVATMKRSPAEDGRFENEPNGLTACIENLEVHRR